MNCSGRAFLFFFGFWRGRFCVVLADNRANTALLEFNLDVIGNLYGHAVRLDIGDQSVNPPGGDYLVTGSQGIPLLIQLFLFSVFEAGSG